MRSRRSRLAWATTFVVFMERRTDDARPVAAVPLERLRSKLLAAPAHYYEHGRPVRREQHDRAHPMRWQISCPMEQR